MRRANVSIMREVKMICWETSEDKSGLPTWERYVAIGHWGLVLTGTFPRWMIRDPAFYTTFYTA